MNEFDIISKYFAPMADPVASLGFNDDAAIIPFTDDLDYIITKDVLSENTHFFPGEEPENVAIKLMRRNISDLAAMGAKPCFFLLACIYTMNIEESWIAKFATALHKESDSFGIKLIGGDSSRNDCGHLHFSLTAIGTCPRGKALKRSGTKAGDDIYVTGNIGDGYLGYLAKKGALITDSQDLKNRYLKPSVRIKLGQKLVGIANSCIDVSDGLLQDLGHIAQTSKVGMDIELELIHVSLAAIATGVPKIDYINHGDDYELAFTAPTSKAEIIAKIAQETGVVITKIGKVTPAPSKLRLLDLNDQELKYSPGWNHFE